VCLEASYGPIHKVCGFRYLGHCAGCHVNGVTIRAAAKTLKLRRWSARRWRPEAMAAIAPEESAQMGGLWSRPREVERSFVAIGVWQQA